MPPKFYRLESDGTPQGTKVFDPDGKELVGVRSVRFEVDARSAAVLHIEVYAGAVVVGAPEPKGL